jgi:hypothetical protein
MQKASPLPRTCITEEFVLRTSCEPCSLFFKSPFRGSFFYGNK